MITLKQIALSYQCYNNRNGTVSITGLVYAIKRDEMRIGALSLSSRSGLVKLWFRHRILKFRSTLTFRGEGRYQSIDQRYLSIVVIDQDGLTMLVTVPEDGRYCKTHLS